MKIKSLLEMQQAFSIIFIASNDKGTRNFSLASRQLSFLSRHYPIAHPHSDCNNAMDAYECL